MTTGAEVLGPSRELGVRRGAGPRTKRVALYVFLTVTALLWLVPILYALYTALRPISDTNQHGYFSLAHQLSLTNFETAWSGGDLPHFFLNTIIITVPAMFVALLFASFVAFAVTRYSWRFNISLLILFTAGNLLPQQVLIAPLFHIYNSIPLPYFLSSSGRLYDSYWGVIIINAIFQMGFCTFILSNYMKTIPNDLTEAALVDGASVWKQYWMIILPLCRPALAALATLEFTWIYNDFFWALFLMSSGDKRPITSALQNLQGSMFTNNNLIAAASLLVAVPTLVVFFVLQRQFVGGLTLGASKN
ncbi:MAG TPA: carbohydrate ABC transporter permease [Nocardioidaceae bacterium]|nr:carbohydrate ABC transporter permease [Nocardioidaceae bacterium]